ncbi:FKBP-type peptidyl-prolyl cis-trans isomerase [Dermacoccus nishinomiyaensis]
MTSPKRLLALAALPIVFLAGCGNDDSKASKSSSGSSGASASSNASSPSSSSGLSAPATKGNLDDVKVDTKDAAKPTVSIPKDKLPFGTSSTKPKILTQGSGKTVGGDSYVKADFVMVNGTTGKTLGSTFGEDVQPFNMSSDSNLPGIITTLKGQKVGTKLVVSLPPKDAFGAAGAPQMGVGANDNLVLYMEIKKVEPAHLPCSTPSNDPNLPKVTVPTGKGKEAKLTFPAGKKAPSELTCSVLKQGDGAVVKAGQSISATYTGQVWNGKVFDSTEKHKDGGKPTDFVIGKGQVITGWDRALVGQKVGSRVLIVVPPSDGYGAQGNAQAGIKGTDTLTFVVDINSSK